MGMYIQGDLYYTDSDMNDTATKLKWIKEKFEGGDNFGYFSKKDADAIDEAVDILYDVIGVSWTG